MSDLIKSESIGSEESLKMANENLVDNTIYSFRSEVFGKFKINLEEKVKQLRDKLQIEFAMVKSNQRFSGERAKNSVFEWTTKYENKMMKDLQKMSKDFKLTEVNELNKNSIKEDLIKICPQNDQATLLAELNKAMDKVFEDKIVYEYNNRKVNLEKEKKFMITRIQLSYKELMKNYKGADIYLKPGEIQQNHSKALNILMKEKEDKNINDRDYALLIKEAIDVTYEKFKEENAMNNPQAFSIGIDLGTSNSCVAIYQNGQVHVLLNENKNATTPSMVAFHPGNQIIGDEAKKDIFANNKTTVYSVKRLMGRSFSNGKVQEIIKRLAYDVTDDGKDNPIITMEVDGKKETTDPELVSSKILSKMKEIAKTSLKFDIKSCVITVPAYFDDKQIKATEKAAELAELTPLKILKEPLAAAFAYKMNFKDDLETR